jgi:uncharacterized membrane protein YccC
MARLPTRRTHSALRTALGHYVLNGVAVAAGLLLISALVHLWLGAFAASAAAVGVIVSIPPDYAAPRRGKLWLVLPAPLLGLPLFFAVQLLHASPLALGLLVVPATFLAFLGMAWGKRGAPVAISVMFAMVFSMAVPAPGGRDAMDAALTTSLYFGLGALLYLPFSVLANLLLNARYRVQLLADVLLSLAALMRLQARQFTPAAPDSVPRPLTGLLLRRHAALADQLQAARDIVLESPSTPRRQRLAGMLIQVLEMRDHLLACELDLDSLRAHPVHASALAGQQEVLLALAGEVENLADALLLGRQPVVFDSLRPRLLAALPSAGQSAEGAAGIDEPDAGFTPRRLARALGSRIGQLNDEALRLVALARNEAEPDLAVVRASWQMFVSPTTWSWRPFGLLWNWDAPPLRHAIRAALAIATGFAIAQQLPWGTHAYWVLLTIVVVLRGSLAQTLERRNSRVAGTLLGCVLALGLLSAQLPAVVLMVCVTVAQAVSHAFAIRRYLITAVAATVLGLVQAHLLNGGGGTALALFERVVDTLIGTGIAWAFAYVLPSWERSQVPALVARTLTAQARHARVALGLGQLHAADNAPELAWRLARREAYDSLSALVQATQRSLSEPRAVRPPLQALEHLQARSYQLLAQLTAVKTLLLQRRGMLRPEQVQAPLELAAERIDAILSGAAPVGAAGVGLPDTVAPGPEPMPGPLESDLSPWLLRRLQLATALAEQLRGDADDVLRPLSERSAAQGILQNIQKP